MLGTRRLSPLLLIASFCWKGSSALDFPFQDHHLHAHNGQLWKFHYAPASPVTSEPSEPDLLPFGSPSYCHLPPPDEWQLPPPATLPSYADSDVPFMAQEANMPMEESAANSQLMFCQEAEQSSLMEAQNSSVKQRLCHVCKLMDATRGVAAETPDRSWIVLACRACYALLQCPTIQLAGRCLHCSRFATFSKPGTPRAEWMHCKQHSLPGDVNLKRTSSPSHSGTTDVFEESVDLCDDDTKSSAGERSSLQEALRGRSSSRLLTFGRPSKSRSGLRISKSPTDLESAPASSFQCVVEDCKRVPRYGSSLDKYPKLCSRYSCLPLLSDSTSLVLYFIPAVPPTSLPELICLKPSNPRHHRIQEVQQRLISEALPA
eukprot:766055-Hanusia_phi.AAC.2